MRAVRMAKKKKAFLVAFRKTGNMGDTAALVGTTRATVYDWRHHDPEFSKAYDAAEEDAADAIEAEVHRRAVLGWEEPLSWQGQLTGDVVRKYSDMLLGLLIKAHKPERFRERHETKNTTTTLILVGEGRMLGASPDPSTIALGPASRLIEAASDEDEDD